VPSVDEVLRRAAADLETIGARWAVIGGLRWRSVRNCGSLRTSTLPSPSRTTGRPRNRQPAAGPRLRARLARRAVLREQALDGPAGQAAGGRVERVHRLLFANSGIEDEAVRRADRLEVLPDVFMPVASTGHLIALKALAGGHQNLTDLGYLIAVASGADLDEATAAAALIEERGFNRHHQPGPE